VTLDGGLVTLDGELVTLDGELVTPGRRVGDTGWSLVTLDGELVTLDGELVTPDGGLRSGTEACEMQPGRLARLLLTYD
jgi:alpha-acetolactate decarboxylase